MTRSFPKRLSVGSRQQEWLYGGPDCWESKPYRFHPTRHHRPPEVLRGLIANGLMWAEKRQRCEWVGRTERWRGPLPGPEHWCGLTAKGLKLIQDRLAWICKHEEEGRQ